MYKQLFKTINIILLVTLFSHFAIASEKAKVTGGSYHEIPGWFKQSFLNINDDVEEAKESNKHVMLFISLEFCPYCTKMLNDNFIVGAKNQEYIQNNFDVIALDVKGTREITLKDDKTIIEKDYIGELGVQYTPTILFLDENSEVVVRVNGYRSSENFKLILDFVKNKEYANMSLTTYLEKVKNKTYYTLQENKLFKKITDLSKINTPLAIIFEDGSCTQCSYFHNTTLKNKDVISELSKYTVVRFDATSNEKIVTPEGKESTVSAWVKDIALDYRPGVLLYDKKSEIARIDALLYSFHFKEMLRYVSGGYYEKYPTFLHYLRPRQNELLKEGISIDLSDKF